MFRHVTYNYLYLNALWVDQKRVIKIVDLKMFVLKRLSLDNWQIDTQIEKLTMNYVIYIFILN